MRELWASICIYPVVHVLELTYLLKEISSSFMQFFIREILMTMVCSFTKVLQKRLSVQLLFSIQR